MRIEVRSPESTAEAWQRLWLRVPGATPFASPAWLLPWARIYAPDRCWIATAESDGGLVGCLPVFWWERRLLLAGTGPSDHGDALVLPGFEDATERMLRALLDEIDKPVDVIDLQQLAPSSPLLAMSGLAGWQSRVTEGDPCPVLMLAGEDGMARVREPTRANWRYAMRRVERAGGRVERVPDGEIDAAIDSLAHLHSLRWQERGEAGVLADPMLRRLLEDAAPELARAGLLRLHRLRIEHDTAGVLLALHGERRTCYYLSGFDPAFARFGPGVAMIGTVIAEAVREGDVAIDFLRGQEPYKYEWSATDEPRFRRELVPDPA